MTFEWPTPFFADEALEFLGESMAASVQLHANRLVLAFAGGDVGHSIGCAKDLCECIVKVALSYLDVSYGAAEDFSALMKRAEATLDLHPSTFDDRPPIRKLLGTVGRIPRSLAELRNAEGSGHGHPSLSAIDDRSHRLLVQATLAWSEWFLDALRAKAEQMAEFASFLQDVEYAKTFTTGTLRSLVFEEMDITNRTFDEQRAGGVALGRRRVSGTFMVSLDIINPFLDEELEVPLAMQLGLFEGLLVDANGQGHSTSAGVPALYRILKELWPTNEEVLAATMAAAAATGPAYAWAADDRAAWQERMKEIDWSDGTWEELVEAMIDAFEAGDQEEYVE